MKKIKIVKDKFSHEFNINKRKIVVGENSYQLFNIIREYMMKSSQSEFSKENKINSFVYLDDKQIDLKYYYLFDLSLNYFDLITEYKLNQKSLFNYSLTTIFNDIDIIDRLSTINILLNDLSIEIEDKYKENNIDIVINDLEINSKSILKLIDFSLIKEELKTNQFDYSISDLNQIKLNLFKMIINNNKQMNFILLNEDPSISTDSFFNYDNILIISNEKNTNNIYDFINKIDFDDEEFLFNLHFNSTTNLSYEKYVTMLLERIID